MSVGINIEHAVKRYGDNTVIHDLSLNVRNGEFFTLLGPSGCGKTTLLRMIAGFNTIENGKFYFDDTLINDMDPGKRNIGMVFQNYAIFPHMTVRQNVAFGLKNRKVPKDVIASETEKFLKLVKIDQYADRMPDALSGGQQQRVALARTLNQNPKIILADEPVASLDPITAKQVMQDFVRINKEYKISILLNIHHVDLALKYCDRVIGIRAGEIVFDGPASTITQEQIDEVYNGTKVPTMGEGEGELHQINKVEG